MKTLLMSENDVTRQFTQAELEHLDVPYNCVSHDMIGKSRWDIHYRGVFLAPDDGHHYRVDYYAGATEQQEGTETFREDPVTCTRVEWREVTVNRWVPVTMEKET